MPLAVGKVALEAALGGQFGDTSGSPAAGSAEKTAKAIVDFVKSGVPMTMITTLPGAVNGGVTSGPVTGKGIGGIDKPSPGMGLEAAKAILETELTAAMTHGGAATAAPAQASKVASAIFNYFSQAIVMTEDQSSGPLPAPPPAGPVTGPMTGQGGVVSSTPGKGYDSAKSKLESDLKDIYSDTSEGSDAASKAKKMAEAIHNFCKEGKVQTQGTFTAPAVVAPPPAPPNGSFLPGQGTSASSTLS